MNEFTGFSKLQMPFWRSVTPGMILAARLEWKAYIDNFEEPKTIFKGRGIIYSG
jgi:hypothetical protein